MKYEFRPGPEALWLIIVTVTGALATAVATQGAVPPTDLTAWGIGLAAGLARALLGALVGAMSKVA